MIVEVAIKQNVYQLTDIYAKILNENRCNFFNKILVHQIQDILENSIYHDQFGLIPRIFMVKNLQK